MKNIICCVLLAIILIVPIACIASGKLTIEQIDGQWVRKKYLDSLRSTLSQFSERPENILISGKNHRLNWTNYHEGAWRKILRIELSKDGYVLVVGQWEVDSPVPSEILKIPFKPTMDQTGKIVSIEFLDNSLAINKKEPFVRLTVPLEEHANELLLVGQYVDQKGKQYTFSKEDVASWPDRTFSYKLPLDSSEAGCDYFQTSDPNEPGRYKRFGFKWKGDRLDLFNIVYDRDYIPIACEGQPFATLVRR
jgi:hypothetical protein